MDFADEDRNLDREPGGTLRCLYCDDNIGRRRKFCSSKCSAQYNRMLYIDRWLVGLESGSDASGELARIIKRYLQEQANDKCTKCGWGEVNPFSNKVILTIDHIDGDWTNNGVDNLAVLCYNCHTLTPTFGSLNKGKFQNGPRSVGSRRH